MLILRQLLHLDHLGYIFSFIRSKIEVLDEAQQSNNMDETTKSPQPITHIYLGSIKRETTVEGFANSSEGNGLTYAPFRRMLEIFLNRFYEAHQLHRERYLEVRREQKVTPETPLFGMGY